MDTLSRRGFMMAMAGVILGQGQHQYELDPGWGQPPSSIQYGYTHGVVVDSHQRVLVHNQSKDAMVIYDHRGRFVKSWGEEFKKGAHGMLLHKEGRHEVLYLADIERNIVVKTTLDGKTLWTLEYPKEPGVYQNAKQYRPTNVAIAPNGDFYVADGYGLSYVHQYSHDAKYIRTWGGKGKEAGQLDCPHGIWVDTRGRDPVLVVADRSNHRLQHFSLDGRHLGFVTDELRMPCHFDQQGKMMVIPDLHGRVTLFDENNKLITHLGDNPDVWKIKGWPNLPHDQRHDGLFISPHAACFDKEGNIYVVEWINDGRVSKLKRVG